MQPDRSAMIPINQTVDLRVIPDAHFRRHKQNITVVFFGRDGSVRTCNLIVGIVESEMLVPSIRVVPIELACLDERLA